MTSEQGLLCGYVKSLFRSEKTPARGETRTDQDDLRPDKLVPPHPHARGARPSARCDSGRSAALAVARPTRSVRPTARNGPVRRTALAAPCTILCRRAVTLGRTAPLASARTSARCGPLHGSVCAAVRPSRPRDPQTASEQSRVRARVCVRVHDRGHVCSVADSHACGRASLPVR